MAKNTFFIVGTDSNIGNTLLTAGILARARQMNLSTVATKPVATGCVQTEEGLRSKEVQLLIDQMSTGIPYDQVNPIALELAGMPSFAAAQAGKRLLVSQMVGFTRGVLMQSVDLAVIEGTGGWREPVNQRESLAGLAKELNLPVILIVNIQPGCLNQCLLTVEAIVRDGVKLAAWIANGMSVDTKISENQGEGFYQEYVATIKSFIRAPCIAEIPKLENPDPEAIAAYVNLDFVITS